ncbi:unnamed protein product [Staurois parvus]|uniref:Right-handed parallel beta-helix repeat-containing protein n=1 Tax=Staurois parvus TaxID=386267 RepID=A0ABN9FTM6_9NEOB|nr:unnamed protein product [Staurois parvus]
MQGPGRPDIVECRVRGDRINSEYRVWGEQILVNAGSGETRYNECRVLGDQI